MSATITGCCAHFPQCGCAERRSEPTEPASYTPDQYFALADELRAECVKVMFLKDRLEEIAGLLGDTPATKSPIPSRDPVYRAYSIADDALEQMERDARATNCPVHEACSVGCAALARAKQSA